jgi:sirohydrochlorin cobaltochelatase
MFNHTAIIFIGHGSRDPESNQEFRKLVESFKKKRTDLNIFYGFVELEKPGIKEIAFELARMDQYLELVFIPVFLFTSRHIKNDIPIIIEQLKFSFPQKKMFCTETINCHPLIIAQLQKRIDQENKIGQFNEQDTALIVVGRGSSDPHSNGEFQKIVRLVEENRNFQLVLPTYIGITRPLFRDTLNLVSRLRPKNILVVPYFLFRGRLIKKLEDQIIDFKSVYPWIKVILASHLGIDENITTFLNSRIDESIGMKKSEPLICTNCEYRPELKSIAKNVKGVESLLWSVRHLYTHAEAKPHEFPHKNLKKHILICENVDCAKLGSKLLATNLRRLIKEDGNYSQFKVTKTSCVGRCGEGPIMVIYPDGVWYRNVGPNDAMEIYDRHIKKDKIIERLVDDIMV